MRLRLPGFPAEPCAGRSGRYGDVASIADGSGQNLLQGSTYSDNIYDGDGNSLVIGGAGDDDVALGEGDDILAFNVGDGVDNVGSREGDSDTISLGGALDYSQLYFRYDEQAGDIYLEVGAGSEIKLDGYFYAQRQGVETLQIFTELMGGYDQNGSDALLDDKVETFDFAGLYAAFEAARAQNPGLDRWALSNALAQFHLGGSDTAAIGGDLAYQYAVSGTLAGIGLTPAQEVINSSQFGVVAQTLRTLSQLQVGAVRLS